MCSSLYGEKCCFCPPYEELVLVSFLTLGVAAIALCCHAYGVFCVDAEEYRAAQEVNYAEMA